LGKLPGRFVFMSGLGMRLAFSWRHLSS